MFELRDFKPQFGLDVIERLFPFSFSFSKNLEIQYSGESIRKMTPELVPGVLVNDFFTIKNPKIVLDYDNILTRLNSQHIWILNNSITMRGEVIKSSYNDSLLFIGSPWLKDASQLTDIGLTSSDFAKHDPTLEHLFMQQAQVSYVADSERMVKSLKKSADENSKLEALQTQLAFEMNIAYDLKIRFNQDGVILDIQAASTMPIEIDIPYQIGKNVYSIIEELHEPLQTAVSRIDHDHSIVPFIFDIQHQHGICHFEARLARTPQNTFLLLANDITDQHILKLQLEKRANYDSLTDLPNRAFFFDQIGETLRQIKAGNKLQTMTMMMIDLDNFKHINDNYGHTAGDYTLQEVSRVLKLNTRPNDIVARLGGDEFAIFTAGENNQKQMIEMAQRICESVITPIKYQGNEFRVGCSIGIAFTKLPMVSVDLFQNQADLAMYHAKESGRGSVVVYQDGMYEQYHKKLSLRSALQKTIDDEEMNLAFQPIVLNDTAEVVGFEALARWHHPDMGDIPPEIFIALAEESGYMVQLGHTLLRSAIKTWASLLQINPAAVTWNLALNISAYQLQDQSFSKILSKALRDYGIEPYQIVLEITETALIRDLDLTVKLIGQLKRQGYIIALDDFGTGYSSLSYLEQLPLDTLKIDRSFVAKLNHTDGSENLVETIVGIAKIMNLDIVAEGVETVMQREKLTEFGCKYAQGFLFSKPIDELELLYYNDQETTNHLQQHAL